MTQYTHDMPYTHSIAILTAAMEMLGGPGVRNQCRKPDIMADAAYAIITKPSSEFTGQFCVDERVLRNDGVTDFLQYQYVKGCLLLSLFSLSFLQYVKGISQSTIESKIVPFNVY